MSDRSLSVAEVASRLGITTHSLYASIKKYGTYSTKHQAKADQLAEARCLKKWFVDQAMLGIVDKIGVNPS